MWQPASKAMQHHHDLLKYVQNKTVDRFWRNEKQARRRKGLLQWQRDNKRRGTASSRRRTTKK
eukprot:CAMPEP_0170173920 /NCGR_PEP_ID=MMETSP0040_2-20121228/7190_1 /TAXON_ID=641309 /ORGANISM="Lotharella oceanica, Strain CCMP622" /LENGTH=62 /DNA_ID=CAMNT_0010415337 /DNA_START=49 /DNA_END=237 /DNA_ORIENTATION=-